MSDGSTGERKPADERRAEIIDAAIELFAEHGFRGTGVIGLAKRVGMTHSGVLYHFGTKQQLLADVVAIRDRRKIESIVEILEDLPADASGFDVIERFAASQFEDPVLLRMFHVLTAENLSAGSDLHDYFADRIESVRQSIRDAVVDPRNDFTVRSDADIDALATVFAGAINGIEQQWLQDPDAIDVDRAHAALFEMVRTYLRASQPTDPEPGECP